jgi:hypothetical protein
MLAAPATDKISMNAVLAPVEQLVAAVYVSSATKPLGEHEILEILRVARLNNEKLDITGMLLYRDGNFLQVLEGPAPAVDLMVAKIKRDLRHHGVILMSRKKIEERQFADWRMAFRNMSKDCSVEQGYSPFLESDLQDDNEAGEESQLVFRLLRRFKEDMR